MASKWNQERSRLFREELKKLESKDYITNHTYRNVEEAYDQYARDLVSAEKEQELASQKSEFSQILEKEEQPTKQAPPKPKKEKKPKTAEQIRERNITWLLTLGVVLLLIVGLVLATSNWDQMGSSLKVFSISFVSLFFLGLSWLLGSLLNIEKTAFAFLTLGSLFVPITVLSIGYFELLGSYLSLTGEGNELLGLLGALISLPLYIRNAAGHTSRLFIWLSYLFGTLAVGFALAALGLPIDYFYFGVMLYNASLLWLYHRYRNVDKLRLFTKELPAYAQLNLIISTLLMLLFFQNEILYSFNIILTAVLYMSMIFVYDTKHYQFVFNALLAYGAYQLIEQTSIGNVDLLLYALVGFVYLALTGIARNDTFMRKVFQYTSALISFLAFLYISFQGIMLRADEASPVLLMAYMMIAINYGYLAYVTRAALFTYLAPVFLVVAGMQSFRIVSEYWFQPHVSLYMYGVGVLLFLGLYVFNKNKYLQPIRSSSFYVALVTGALALMFELVFEQRSYDLAAMFLTTALMAYVVWKVSGQKMIQNAALAVHPASIGIASIVFYSELKKLLEGYSVELLLHIALTAILLIVISYLWKRTNIAFGESTFITSQVFYTISWLMVLSFDIPINEEFGRPFVFLLGVIFYTLLVRRYEIRWFWGLVSLMTLGFYGSLYEILNISGGNGIITFVLLAPVLLMVISQGLGRRFKEIRPYFYWLAHLIQPFFVFVALVAYVFGGNVSPFLFFIPMVIYVYSTWKATYRGERYSFLYATLTFIPLILYLFADHNEVFDFVQKGYVFVAASMIMLILWGIANDFWRKCMDGYFIIFNVVGGYIFVVDAPHIQLYEIGVIIPYLILVLWTFHRRDWTMFNFIPLILTFYMWVAISESQTEFTLLTLSLMSFLILGIAGYYLHKWVYEKGDIILRFDCYSVIAVFYLAFSYVWIDGNDLVLLRILPLLLLTIFLWIQHRRFQDGMVQNIFKTLAAISVFAPYYVLYEEYHQWIPKLLEAEVLALPWLAMAIGLSLRTWRGYLKLMQHVQTIVLILVTTYLTFDAIQSNTIWDALIMGILSLISVIVGMQLRIKSYFFVGVGVLLLNVFLQTKPYWGNMPWWAYLLIAGSTLIFVASYNEWQKQKSDREGKSIIQTKAKLLLQRLKEWD